MIDLTKIEAVIFDQDGLMFNTEDVYRAAIERMGLKRGKVFTNEIHRKMMGRAAYEDVSVLLEAWGLNEDVHAAFEERQRDFIEASDSLMHPEPGLFELLDAVEQLGLRKAIVTGSVRALTDRNLSKFNLQDRFELIVTGESVTHGKPDPEIYRLATNKLQLDPANCLVLEDSVNGIRSAKAAGCQAFAVPNKFNQDDDFSMADARFRSLTEIAELFQRMKK